MKLRFQKRAAVRVREREARMLRHDRDRHDRAWLIGPGQWIGNWRVVFGLFRIENGELRCAANGLARLEYVGAAYRTTDELRAAGWMVHDPTAIMPTEHRVQFFPGRAFVHPLGGETFEVGVPTEPVHEAKKP